MRAIDTLRQTQKAAARSLKVFVCDVGRGLLEVSHNTLALVGLAAIAVAVFSLGRADIRAQLEVVAFEWLQTRHEERREAMLDAPTKLLQAVAEPEGVARATAADLQALTRQQAQLAVWIARRYKVAPEPIGALVKEAWAIGQRAQLDPTLILAIMAIESSFNPFAQSPVGAQGLHKLRDGNRQPGLARPPWPGQGDEPDLGLGQKRRQLRELAGPTDDGRRRRWQVRRRSEALQRWKVPRHPWGYELCEAFRFRNVLQPVPAELLNVGIGEVAGDKLGCGRRQHKLAPVSGPGDARSTVDVHSDVAVLMPGRLPGMQPHPNVHPDAVGPVVGVETSLGREGGLGSVRGGGEHDEEAVPFRSHLGSTPTFDLRPQDVPLRGQSLSVPVTQSAQKLRRAFDVAEEQRHSAGGKRLHVTGYLATGARRVGLDAANTRAEVE